MLYPQTNNFKDTWLSGNARTGAKTGNQQLNNNLSTTKQNNEIELELISSGSVDCNLA